MTAPHGSSLSDLQQIILSVLMMLSATLSIVGSWSIVYRVALNPQKTRSYDRIMLGLTCADIIGSLGFLLSPILVPAETSSRIWASGTNVSCSMLGWLRQLGFSSLGYNAFLSLYYVMNLKFNISAEDFAASYEAYIHFLTIFYFLATATAGFVFQLYDELPVGMGCWVSDGYCFNEKYCVGGLISWVYGAFAIIGCFVTLIISHLVIYFHIRGIFKRHGTGVPTEQSVHIQRIAVQGFLYVVSFFISYLPASILRYLEIYFGYDESRESEIYGVLVLHAMCMPMQGFFNMFIYSRPGYIKLVESGVPFWKAIWKAACEPDIPRFIEQYRLSTFGEELSSVVQLAAKQLQTPNRNASQVLQSILEAAENEKSDSEEPFGNFTDKTLQSEL